MLKGGGGGAGPISRDFFYIEMSGLNNIKQNSFSTSHPR